MKMVEETESQKPMNIFRNLPMYDGRHMDHVSNPIDVNNKECSQNDDIKPLISQYNYPDMVGMDTMRSHLDVKSFGLPHSDDIKPILAECQYTYSMNAYASVKCEKYSPVSFNISNQIAPPIATSTIRYCGSTIVDEQQTVHAKPPSLPANDNIAAVLCSTTTPSSPTPYPPGTKCDTKPKSETKKGTRRPEKPQISYINLIAKVILDSPCKQLTLNEIYTALKKE